MTAVFRCLPPFTGPLRDQCGTTLDTRLRTHGSVGRSAAALAAQVKGRSAGVFFSRSEDATGADRNQVIDSNWLVVGQTPAPGSPIGEGDAVLSVVKYGEANPCGL